MKTALVLAAVILAGSAGDVLITKGMKQVGEISSLDVGHLLAIAKKIAVNKSFLGGLFFMATSFFAFLAALSWADLSFIMPATSLSFVVSTLGAKLALKEKISGLRWAGTLLVCAGVALLSLP